MPASEHLAQKDTVTVRGKCVIYTSEGNGVELRSFQKTLHNAPPRLRESPKAGNAAKGNRFHKTVGNKGTARWPAVLRSLSPSIRVLIWQD